jgi:hypothetical protein
MPALPHNHLRNPGGTRMTDDRPSHDPIDTAHMIKDLRNGTIRKEPFSIGVSDAALILQERGDLDLSDRDSTLSFSRAVHDVAVHEAAGDTDMYEGPRDVARGVLAAWSLDQIREDHSGREVREDHDRFIRDIGGYDESVPAVEDGPSVLHADVWEMTIEAVLANASLPTEFRDGQAAWEIRLDDLGRSDHDHGLHRMGGSNGHDAATAHDVAQDAAVDAMNHRYEHERAADTRDEPMLEEAVRITSDARRSFPGELTPLQEGLIAAESWHALNRGGGPDLQPSMGDSAVARILDRGDEDRLTAQDAARVILVDTALQLSAEVTAREGSYGGPVRDSRLPIDRMLADLDRTDGLEGGSYHPKEVNDRIAEGRFDAIPDMGVQFALSDGLREARKPFSRPVENQLAVRLAVLKGERDRASDIALGTPSSLRGPKSVAKGPADAGDVLAHAPSKGAER